MVRAARERCVELLLDVEGYPQWYETLDAVVVLERDGETRPTLVRAAADAGPLGTIEFVLRLDYHLPDRIDGVQTGGNGKVEGVRNRWLLEAVGPGQTAVTYSFEASAAGRRSGLVLRAARSLVERDLIRGFAEALARRAGGD